MSVAAHRMGRRINRRRPIPEARRRRGQVLRPPGYTIGEVGAKAESWWARPKNRLAPQTRARYYRGGFSWLRWCFRYCRSRFICPVRRRICVRCRQG